MAKRHEIDRFLTTLILILVGVLAGCGEDTVAGSVSTADAGLCDGVESVSTRVDNHEHLLCIATADLNDPPEEGIEYETDETAEVPQAHTHRVSLTQTQLQMIADNETVTVTTSSTRDHTHQFTLGKPSGS